MHFIDEFPDFFIGCDPDTRNAAYAVLDKEGKVYAAWTISSTSNLKDQVIKHLDHLYNHDSNVKNLCLWKTVAAVEGQVVYKNDKKSNPADLIKLARSSGVSSTYVSQMCRDLQIVTPLQWKGNRKKHAHQADILIKLGQEPVIKGKGDHRYAVPKDNFLGLNQTQYKHVIDAIGIAMWLRESYLWEFKKRKKLKE